MMLPDGSGLDVLDALQQRYEADRPTTVVLTASHDAAIRQKCKALQVHDYINKPVHESKFMRVVRAHKELMIHSTPMLASV